MSLGILGGSAFGIGGSRVSLPVAVVGRGGWGSGVPSSCPEGLGLQWGGVRPPAGPLSYVVSCFSQSRPVCPAEIREPHVWF